MSDTRALILFEISESFALKLEASPIFTLLLAAIACVLFILYLIRFHGLLSSYDIEEAEIGLGDQRIRLRPNDTDRQIAYQIWVELKTRKIGLPIDLDHDTIEEVYDSWYSFFGITRELVKGVPVSKFRRKDTEKIVRLSIEVLNSGIRPHLTKWQARFRRWYEYEVKKDDNIVFAPQDIQKNFPMYSDLESDMLRVNRSLMAYRDKMYEIVSGERR